jgi:PAS domain S-box-containing protein
VILDVGLPDVNGIDLCRRIKSDPDTAMILVLQVSASFTKSADRARALEGGADSFMVEPADPDVLIATINALLRLRRAEELVLQSAREWSATFDAISEGVVLLDADDRVLRGNRAFTQHTGLAAEEMAGRPWPELLEQLSRDDSRTDASTVGANGTRASFRVGDRWLQVSAMPVADAARRGAARVVVLTDVSDHMKALAAAEEANRLKDEFLAVLSHELRTPLNAIVGWAHLLQSGGLDATSTARAFQTIARNAQVQSQLISDILDVSRIVAGKLRLEREPTHVAAAVEAALETVHPSAIAKEITLKAELDREADLVFGDPARLQQVAWNLLSNAIKFSPAQGVVTVRLAAAGDDVEVLIQDEGPGIRREFLPYVFDRFRQADSSSSRPKGGLGLGLAIVRHLVELHGGAISAANRTDRSGAIFRVRIPSRAVDAPGARPALSADTASPAEVSHSLAGVRVLIVDDEEDARELVVMTLERYGAEVLTAASSFEALPVLERERPDVLLSDLEMPGEDGYEFIRKVRALGPLRGGRTPAAAFTAYARPEDKKRVLDSGFQAHLAKPAQPNEIVSAVATLAEKPP